MSIKLCNAERGFGPRSSPCSQLRQGLGLAAVISICLFSRQARAQTPLDVGDSGVASESEQHPQTYTITALGTIYAASGLNNSREVIGPATISPRHAFLWQHETMTDLGTLGGTTNYAIAINEEGQVAGQSTIAGDAAFHAYRWEDGTFTDLGTLGGVSSVATGIDDRGRVFGNSVTTTGQLHPFMWQNGHMTDLLSAWSGPAFSITGVSHNGIVVGCCSNDPTGQNHVFLWRHGRIEDLGTLGGTYTQSTAVNDKKEIVGVMIIGNNNRPFFWHHGEIDFLAAPVGVFGYPISINNRGQVVGFTFPPDGSGSRAVLWQDGQLTDLNTLIPADSGWVLYSAQAINDRGEIAGQGTYNGEAHAFLLTPSHRGEGEE